MMFVSGCETISFKDKKDVTATLNTTPQWPVAGKKVAEELDRVCPLKKEGGIETSSCPAIDEWISRLVKLQAQLEAAR